MSRIKEKLLSLYTKHLIKARRAERTNVGFQQAQRIGILYSRGSTKKQEAVNRLATQLRQLGKQVTKLCYATTPTPVNNLADPTITPRDIQLFGRIIYPQAKSFVNTPFDYLYQVDLEGQPVLDYLLAKSQAKCRVGHYTAARAALFEIMVSFEQQPGSSAIDALTAQMLHYTQLLAAK